MPFIVPDVVGAGDAHPLLLGHVLILKVASLPLGYNVGGAFSRDAW